MRRNFDKRMISILVWGLVVGCRHGGQRYQRRGGARDSRVGTPGRSFGPQGKASRARRLLGNRRAIDPAPLRMQNELSGRTSKSPAGSRRYGRGVICTGALNSTERDALTFSLRAVRLLLRLQSQQNKIYARRDFSRVKTWRGEKLLRRRT
jgi:hypothetical protein